MMIPYTKTAGGATDDTDSGLGNYLSEPLRRLRHLRRDLNHHRRTGHPGPLPQPWRYGLNLPDLRPSEIFWSGGKR